MQSQWEATEQPGRGGLDGDSGQRATKIRLVERRDAQASGPDVLLQPAER